MTKILRNMHDCKQSFYTYSIFFVLELPHFFHRIYQSVHCIGNVQWRKQKSAYKTVGKIFLLDVFLKTKKRKVNQVKWIISQYFCFCCQNKVNKRCDVISENIYLKSIRQINVHLKSLLKKDRFIYSYIPNMLLYICKSCI